MRQFTVPQFIDVEDKIIGPLTVRQFLIMLTGFAVIGVSYKFADFSQPKHSYRPFRYEYRLALEHKNKKFRE